MTFLFKVDMSLRMCVRESARLRLSTGVLADKNIHMVAQIEQGPFRICQTLSSVTNVQQGSGDGLRATVHVFTRTARKALKIREAGCHPEPSLSFDVRGTGRVEPVLAVVQPVLIASVHRIFTSCRNDHQKQSIKSFHFHICLSAAAMWFRKVNKFGSYIHSAAMDAGVTTMGSDAVRIARCTERRPSKVIA
jgi:hypothetical protein